MGRGFLIDFFLRLLVKPAMDIVEFYN